MVISTMRRARVLIAVACLGSMAAAGDARAQSLADIAWGVYAAPPAVVCLLADLGLAWGLSSRGYASRGLGITNVVFASIDVLMSGITLALAASGSGSRPTPVLAGSTLAIGAASAGFSFYALAHGPPPEPEPLNPMNFPPATPPAPTLVPQAPAPDQLSPGLFLTPLFWGGARGGVGGLSLSGRF